MIAPTNPRHAGLDPASSAALDVRAFCTPDQVRGDELAISVEGSVG